MGWGVLLLFYYQQLVGVDAALVGLAIAIALIVDAISDPVIGAWSDRLHSRWGRRHPMLFVAALPLDGGFVALFNPPADLTDFQGFCWLLVFGIFTRLAFTFYYIPHLALGASHEGSDLLAIETDSLGAVRTKIGARHRLSPWSRGSRTF